MIPGPVGKRWNDSLTISGPGHGLGMEAKVKKKKKKKKKSFFFYLLQNIDNHVHQSEMVLLETRPTYNFLGML